MRECASLSELYHFGGGGGGEVGENYSIVTFFIVTGETGLSPAPT